MAPRLSGGRGKFDLRHKSAMDVTPLVGVLLLLLVVFMVTAPLSVSSTKIDLPSPFGIDDRQPFLFIVSVERGQRLYIGALPTSLETVVSDIGEIIGGPRPTDHVVMVRANRFVPYGKVMTVMSTLKEAGYEVGLIMEDL